MAEKVTGKRADMLREASGQISRTFRFSKVRPSTQSAPPDSSITLYPQSVAGIAHALQLFC